MALVSPSLSAAARGCGWLGLGTCQGDSPPPPLPAPDPGGNEAADVKLPPAGKRLGFNSQLGIGITTPQHEVGLGRTVGATLQRYPVAWSALQPTRQSPRIPTSGSAKGYLTNLDKLYAELTSHEMTPILSFGRAPLWATDYGDCGLFDGDCKHAAKAINQHPNGANLDEYARFVAAIAARYPKAVVEPWNEPNIKPFWQPDAPNPWLYTSLQCAVYDEVGKLPAPNLVTSAGFGSHSKQRSDGSPLFADYLNATYYAGLRSCMDALNVHVYGANIMSIGAGSPFAEEWAIIREVRARYGDTTKMWVTETGTSTIPKSTGITWGVTQAQQADRNARLYNRLATMGDVAAIAFNSLRDAPSEHQQYEEPGWHYGFLRKDFSPKPAFCELVRKASAVFAGC